MIAPYTKRRVRKEACSYKKVILDENFIKER